MTNLELQDYMLKNRTKRLFSRLHVSEDLGNERISGIIKKIKEFTGEIEIIVLYKSIDSIVRLEEDFSDLIERTHIDNLPYMDIIISVPVSEENAKLCKELEDGKLMIIINRYEDIIKKDFTTKDIYEHDKKQKKTFNLKVVYNRNGCLGSGHCALSDNRDFKIEEDFKATLIDGKEMEGPIKGLYFKTFSTEEPHLIINAAKTCTPKVIAVIDMDTGKRIAP